MVGRRERRGGGGDFCVRGYLNPLNVFTDTNKHTAAVVVMVMNGLHSLFRRRAISGHQQRGSLGDSDVVCR